MRTLSLASLALAFAALAAIEARAATPPVTVDLGQTRRICQLTGQTDRQTGRPTINETEGRARFWGTDLGASFEHQGRTVFLFGDTHATAGLDRLPDRDTLAFSSDREPEDCLALDFQTDPDGGFRPLTVAGVDGGGFSVPSGGYSAGDALYVAVTAGRTETEAMTRSVLARSDNGGRDFTPVRELSARHFINAAFARSPEMPGQVLMWGSGRYRASDVRLAVMDEDGGRPRYFAGAGADGQPRWSASEDEAAPLLGESCVGELSVAWAEPLAKWVMTYNCGAPQSRVMLRTADRPWGPWSSPQVLFDAEADGAYCAFMHRPDCAAGLSDPHTPQIVGDVYAPYLIAGMTRGEKGGHADIYFLMSTWNPYNVMLMKARLILHPPATA